MSAMETWPKTYTTTSEEATEQVAAEIAKWFQAGDVIALHGELGAGKTCLVRGLAKGLGSSDLVNSPTFTIINQYQGRLPIYHFDVYRMNDVVEIEDLDLDYYLYGQGVSIIEWAEKALPLLPPDHWSITIKIDFQNTRSIEIIRGKKDLTTNDDLTDPNKRMTL